MTLTALVVDDDPSGQRAIARGLRGYDVVAVGSAEAALAWVERHGAPAVAVVDVTLPRMSGFELASVLKDACRVLVAGARPGMELFDEARALELDVALVDKHAVASVLAPAAPRRTMWSKLAAAFA